MAKTTTLTWTIENYSKMSLIFNEHIYSPDFMISQGKQKWRFEFYPNGESRDPNGVLCFLSAVSGIQNITVVYAFKLISPEGKAFFSDEMLSNVFNDNKGFGKSLTTIERLKKEMKEWGSDVLTIQCSIDFENSSSTPHLDFQAKSKIGLNILTFTWCVKEPDSSEWSQRKVFTCAEKTSLEIILTTAEDDILMEIKNISDVDIKQLSITGKISVVDVNNVEHLTMKDSHVFFGSGNNISWKFPTFVTKKALISKKCMENECFNLILEFTVPNGIITNELNYSTEYDDFRITTHELNYITEYDDSPVKSEQRIDVMTALHHDLKQMFLDQKHSDMNFKAGDQLFPAHKCLLSSRSPVFRAMFDSEMLENQSNVVEITDLDSTTLDSLLKFLYTGSIDDSSCESTLKLMLAADKYQVESLTEKCAEILVNFLSPDNVCDIILIADAVKHHFLKTAAIRLIEDYSEDILSSTKWSEWSKQNLSLAFEITSQLAMRCSILKKNTK